MSSPAPKYTPRAKKATAAAQQLPIMADVSTTAAALPPEVAQPPVQSESIALFAHIVGDVEALAAGGHHELIMQAARIAYTRARQVERIANGEQP